MVADAKNNQGFRSQRLPDANITRTRLGSFGRMERDMLGPDAQIELLALAGVRRNGFNLWDAADVERCAFHAHLFVRQVETGASRFIGGLPRKDATKVVYGARYTPCGVPTWTTLPRSMMATRCARAIASAWPWVA